MALNTVKDLIDGLKAQYGQGFWDSLSQQQQQHYRDMAQSFIDDPKQGPHDYLKWVSQSNVYTNYAGQSDGGKTTGSYVPPPSGGGGGAKPPGGINDPTTYPGGGNPPPGAKGGGGGGGGKNGGGSGGGGGHGGPGGGPKPPPPPPPGPPDPQPPQPPTPEQNNLLAQISQLLTQWSLPTSLTSFIQGEITANKGYDEIINDLRNTSEYKAAFPENPERIKNGYSAWSEQQILEYRDQAKQMLASTLGITDFSTSEISHLIANNKSLSEWANDLQAYKRFEVWGPSVKQALSQELGYDVSDERAFAVFSEDIPTPELDMALERAQMRGQPAVLGFGIRPEEEAQTLLEHGIDPNQAFAGYQGIAAELPRANRLALIDNALTQGNTPDAATAIGDTSFNTLFKAIQLRDPTAIQQLSSTIANETARWQAGGGVAGNGEQALGLLTEGERQGV